MGYIDDKIVHIDDDIEKIRTKPGMYMSYVGSKGTLHMAKEVIQNSIDECINDKSPADKIKITYDADSKILSVEDNGRGIPPDSMEISCTKINAGSKMTRSSGGATSGENGCGLTCVNAMSNMFAMTVYRDDYGKQYNLEFSEGRLKSNNTCNDKSDRHGTLISFAPSVTGLGSKNELPWSELVKWTESISYLINEKMKTSMTLIKNGKVKEEFTFKSKKFSDLIKDRVNKDKMMTDVVSLHSSKKLKEKLLEKTYDRDVSIDVAFCYAADDPYIDTYCNFVNTIDNGSHFDGVKDAICRYLQKTTKDSMSDKEKLKMDIVWNDIMDGLSIAVNLKSTLSVGFTGQTKQKIDKQEIFDICKELTASALSKYFDSNKPELLRIVKIVRTNAKARLEMNKVKTAVIKENSDIWKEHRMSNYIPANNRGKQYKELFIIEGESAKGSAANGRDPDTQALYAMRGVSANAFKRDLSGILNNDLFKDLVKILKCNIGEKFDIDKLNFSKIIIATDADIDGFGIRSIVAAFFFRFMPEIIENGLLYVVIPPLYEIDSSTNKFVVDKRDYVSRFIKNIVDIYSITINMTGQKLDKSRLSEFIYDTKDYIQDLSELSDHFRVNRHLIELLGYHAVMMSGWGIPDYEKADQLFESHQATFLVELQKVFPEVGYSNGYVRGIIDGRMQSIELNPRFFRRLAHIYPIYMNYGLFVSVKSGDDNVRDMTISDFLTMTSKYRPKIITRFKGLGENDPEDLWDTTLNPNNRSLIQLRTDDYDRDMDMFHIMHSPLPKYAALRKNMMANYQIDRDDLDN